MSKNKYNKRNIWWPPKDTVHNNDNRSKFTKKKYIIKAWITHIQNQDKTYQCHLILENGHPMYSCTCTHPKQAKKILWDEQDSHKLEWQKAGLQIEIVDEIEEDKLPQHVFDNNRNDVYIDFMKKYFPHHIAVLPEVVVNVKEEK